MCKNKNKYYDYFMIFKVSKKAQTNSFNWLLILIIAFIIFLLLFKTISFFIGKKTNDSSLTKLKEINSYLEDSVINKKIYLNKPSFFCDKKPTIILNKELISFNKPVFLLINNTNYYNLFSLKDNIPFFDSYTFFLLPEDYSFLTNDEELKDYLPKFESDKKIFYFKTNDLNNFNPNNIPLPEGVNINNIKILIAYNNTLLKVYKNDDNNLIFINEKPIFSRNFLIGAYALINNCDKTDYFFGLKKILSLIIERDNLLKNSLNNNICKNDFSEGILLLENFFDFLNQNAITDFIYYIDSISLKNDILLSNNCPSLY